MKHVFAVALIAATLSLAGSAAAAATVPKAYPGKNALVTFTRANPPDSPQLTGVTRGHAPKVVIKGGHLMAGPVHANLVVSAGASGYLDQAAPGVRFTYIKTYFNLPSVNSSTGCNGNPAEGSVLQVVRLDQQEAGAAEVGCDGVTTADFFYNVAGYGLLLQRRESWRRHGNVHHRYQDQRVCAAGERPVHRRAPAGDNGLSGQQLPG